MTAAKETQHQLKYSYDRNTAFKECIFNLISENKSDSCLLILVLEQLISATIINSFRLFVKRQSLDPVPYILVEPCESVPIHFSL